MGKVSFARVDERLIHGQVVVTIASSTDANVIYIVDDELAKDDFTQIILEASAKKANMGFKALSIEDTIASWNDNQFGDDKVLLITKNIQPMIEIAKGGVQMDAINIGNAAKIEGAVQISNSAAATKEQVEEFKKIADEQGTRVYFQTIPGSSGSTSLESAIKKF